MGWIVKTEKPCEHKGKPGLPGNVINANRHMLDDIWQCDECQAKFRVSSSLVKEGMQWDMYDVEKFRWVQLYK